MHAWISHWHDQVAASVSHMHAPPCHACREGRGGHLGTRGIGWYGPIWQLPQQPACQLSLLVRLLPRERRGRPQGAVGTKTLSLLNVPVREPAATSPRARWECVLRSKLPGHPHGCSGSNRRRPPKASLELLRLLRLLRIPTSQSLKRVHVYPFEDLAGSL